MAKISRSLTELVALRAGRRCEYCHAPQELTGQTFHVDHIIPLSAGGRTIPDNLCFACSHCNIAKRNLMRWIDSKTGKRVRLFNPRVDDWNGHFRWSSDWKRLTGQSAIGRATIDALKMNDSLLQEARPFWRFAGRLP
jgi:hypothetical protein